MAACGVFLQSYTGSLYRCFVLLHNDITHALFVKGHCVTCDNLCCHAGMADSGVTRFYERTLTEYNKL